MRVSCFIFILLCSSSAIGQNAYKNLFGDSIKEYTLSCAIAYLPSPQSERTLLRATPAKLTAKHSEYKRRRIFRSRRTFNTKRTRKVRISKQQFLEINDLYASLSQPFVNFALSDDDKDSLRSFLKDSTYYGAARYKVSSTLLENYLKKDSIRIDMSVFEKDSLTYFMRGVVMDGAPFRFQMMSISTENDTLSKTYDGNLVGSDRFRDYSDFLLFYGLNAESDLFKHLPLDYYFSRSKFLRVILDYIEGNEGLLEFNPSPLPWEDE